MARSVYPWDIVITKVELGGDDSDSSSEEESDDDSDSDASDAAPKAAKAAKAKDPNKPEPRSVIFLDKRDGDFDLLTVHETALEQPEACRGDQLPNGKPNINTSSKLSIEATAINENFSQQVLVGGKAKAYDAPNPFVDEEDLKEAGAQTPASVAYRYRRWNLGKFNLVARTELHAHNPRKKDLLTCFALNEWDSKIADGVHWRKNLDAHRGAVLATELKNNSYKLGKWTVQTLLAGADRMLLGYVSRKVPSDPFKHEVLGTQAYIPTNFATQINLNQNNMWAVLKSMLELVDKHPPGKYVVARDPKKPIIRMYSVPMDTFEEDDDEEEEEDDVAELAMGEAPAAE